MDLVEVNGSSPAAEASISLLPDGTFTMRPGCNTGDGTYAIVGNRLEAEVMSLTMKRCGGRECPGADVVTVLEADPGSRSRPGRAGSGYGADGTVLLFEAP